jgi:hypothetical protein
MMFISYMFHVFFFLFFGYSFMNIYHSSYQGRRCRYRKVDGFTTTYAISTYHHLSCEFEPRSWRGVLDTTL